MVRKNQATKSMVQELAETSYQELSGQLTTDTLRKVFWINIYNAYYQLLRQQLDLRRPHIFTRRVIRLAGVNWSLDDIEHGVLRRFRYKYSLGYLPNIFVPKRIKENTVDLIDYRIHFALNCGAESCPPIVIYSVNTLEKQLEQASASFLDSETEIDKQHHIIYTSRILFWFLNDFGGMKGIRRLLEETFEASLASYKIRFRKYSWSEKLNNFKDFT